MSYRRPLLERAFRSPALPLFACWVSACRPASYEAPVKDPSEPALTIPLGSADGLGPEHLSHAALYGVDSAPPSALTPPPDAIISPTGLTSAILDSGTGKRTPSPGDSVVFHFTGWNKEGERFDSSYSRGRAERRKLDSLTPGWREGIEHMVVGEKRRLWIPERLAFGPVPSPGKPSGDLIVDIELLEMVAPPKMPETPKDLAAAPPEAKTTASGLRYLVLKKGSGTRTPSRSDNVQVHYTGWSKDGTVFDSSIPRGEPMEFGVAQVIPGWTEMLLLMVEGQHVRVWIPSKLAYGDNPDGGRPAGQLVFEVELLQIL